MRVEKIGRDRRYRVRQVLLMLLLLSGSIVAFLIAGKQIPAPQLVAGHAPDAAAMFLALFGAAAGASAVSGSRDPVKRHIELTLNWDCGYEPYSKYPGTDELLSVVRSSSSNPGLIICLTPEPTRAAGALLRAAALNGAVPLLVPIGFLEASGSSVDKIWAQRLSNRRIRFPVPRPYRLLVVIDCADRKVEAKQLESLDHWQRTWPTSSVVVVAQHGGEVPSLGSNQGIRLIELDDKAAAPPPEAQLERTLDASGIPENTGSRLTRVALLGTAKENLLVFPPLREGQRTAWFAGMRVAIRIAVIYAVLTAAILAVSATQVHASAVGLVLVGLTNLLLLPTLSVLTCGVPFSVSRKTRPVSSRYGRLGLAAAAGAGTSLFVFADTGLSDEFRILGFGLSCAILMYARMTELARGDSVSNFANRYKHELLCAVALMAAWQVVSYQISYADTAAWTLVLGAIGFRLCNSARSQNRSAINACASALLLVIGLSGLVGPSLVGTGTVIQEIFLPSRWQTFLASDIAVELGGLGIVLSFVLFAAVIMLKWFRFDQSCISVLTLWMAGSLSIAIAQPFLSAVQQLPAMVQDQYAGVDTFVILALVGGAFLGLLLTVLPGTKRSAARETACAALLTVVATTSIVPGNSIFTGGERLTGPYSSVLFIGLVLMLTLWLALSAENQSIFRWILGAGNDVINYIFLAEAALAGVFFYTVGQIGIQQIFLSLFPAPSVPGLLISIIDPFGPAALTALLCFLVLALARRLRRFIICGLRVAGRHILASLVILGTFFMSLQLQEPGLAQAAIPAPAQAVAPLDLLLAITAVLAAFLLWHLLKRHYVVENSELAVAIGAIGLFVLGNSPVVGTAVIAIILGGPLDSLSRSFRRPDKASLMLCLKSGMVSFILLWVLSGRDVSAAVIGALAICTAVTLVHPVDARMLSRSILRSNQLRLRQAIYWVIAIASPVFFLSPTFGVAGEIVFSTGWQATFSAVGFFFIELVLIGSISGAWVAGGWWAAASSAATGWLDGLRTSEDAYGRYYATVRETLG